MPVASNVKAEAWLSVRVTVPVNVDELIVGDVNVLLVNVWAKLWTTIFPSVPAKSGTLKVESPELWEAVVNVTVLVFVSNKLPVTLPVTVPSILARSVPLVPENTSLVLVAPVNIVNLAALSSQPINPTLAEPSLYLNSRPLSKLSSDVFWPNVIIGSATVNVVLFTVVVVPLTCKSPETITLPVPLPLNVKSIAASPPVAVILGLPLVAAFVTVISLTALPVWENLINSRPAASAINPPSANLGSVNVLLVNVCSCASNAIVSLPVKTGKLIVLLADKALATALNW